MRSRKWQQIIRDRLTDNNKVKSSEQQEPELLILQVTSSDIWAHSSTIDSGVHTIYGSTLLYITARVHQMIMQQWHAATTTRHSYTLTYQFLTDLQTFDLA